MTNIYLIISNLNTGSYSMKYNLIKKINLKKVNLIVSSKIIPNKNSLYIIIKKVNSGFFEEIKKLKKYNNYFIFEPLDLGWNKEPLSKYVNFMSSIIENFDYIIFNSKYTQSLFAKNVNNSSVIYHEYDSRFSNNSKVQPIVQYIGSESKSSFSKKDFDKYNISHVHASKYINNFKDNVLTSIHIDHLNDNFTYYHIHTATKLSTAIYYNSIFICNKIPVYVELLGNDYNLYLKDDLSNIEEIISNAKEIINDNDLYNNYVSKMKNVKRVLSPENVKDCYEKIIKSFLKKIKKNKI